MPDVCVYSVRPLSAVQEVNAANDAVCIIVDDNVVIIVLQKHEAHGTIPCGLMPALPAGARRWGDDFIARTGRAHPRVTEFPARPPGISRRDLMGMKFKLRIIA